MMADAASNKTQFIHCSQFYEMVLGIGFFAVVTAQYLVLRFELWRHVDKMVTEEQEDYIEWLRKRVADSQRSNQPPQMNEVEKEINQIESKGDNSASAPQPDPQPINLLAEPNDQQKRYLYLYQQVNEIFGEYLPILFCTLLLGILTGSTLVFTLAMFFCYVFSTTIFNYMKLYHRLKKKYRNESLGPYVGLLGSCFIIALFISYFIRSEFFGA